MSDSVLSAATCRGSEFAKAELNRVIAHDTDFTEARFLRTEAFGADFTGAIFDGAYVHLYQSGSSFSGASFRDAVLGYMDFESADLTDTDFTGASGSVHRVKAGDEHPSWEGLELIDLLRRRGADVEYFVSIDDDHNLKRWTDRMEGRQ